MAGRQLSTQTRVYVWTVILSGAGVAAYLLATSAVRSWNWIPIALFGLLGIIASALSLTYQGYLPSRIVHQIGASFAYALFLLADPGAVCVVLWVMSAADWAVNRRRPLTAAFNMAQLTVALGAAALVRGWIRPGFTTLDGVDTRTMAAAVASLVAFFLVNETLTQIVLNLANRRPWFSFRTVTTSGLLNEVLCIVSGLGMAVFWWVSPWLVILGVAPIWLVTLLLILLSRREQALEWREAELRSLQGLGLEIGAELDVERLRRAVVRIATDALQASGALLAVTDGARENLRVQAHVGIRHAPPEKLPLSPFVGELFESGSIRLVSPSRAERCPELAFLDAAGLLCAPLEILGRRGGLLVLFHGERRRPFNEDDVHRLETLARFVNVALSNAQLVADIKEMQEQLVQSEKMSALGMLISGVSHELNNPLTSVVGFTELLMAGETDPEKYEMLSEVLRQSHRAMKIVQSLLTFSRKHKPEKKLTDMNHVLDQVLELRGHEPSVRNVEVVRRLAPALPRALADPHQFEQVFLNLLTNAEQALKQKGGPGRIEIESRIERGRIHVLVSDNGPGIEPEHLKQIFLPFFTTKELGYGTGLGLSICYGIVKEHGGRIAVDSSPGKGATFCVEIPIAEQDAESDRHVPLEEPGPTTTFHGGRLLVVEDEEPIIELIATFLEPRGWSVIVARDGAEALELVGTSPFDVLLVDLRMPGMDGQTFYERLSRSHPELARKVVFTTGDVASEEAARFLERADNLVLGKPYDLKTLAETVSRVAGQSTQIH